MRVIAGTLRGRRLLSPEGLETRPISDRVKGSLFDMLGSRLATPGSLPELRVLDLFCGPGSLGIEALSRGAACCTFVDASVEALDCLRQNLKTLGLESRSRIVRSRAERLAVEPMTGGSFDLVFFDPPYALSEEQGADSKILQACRRFGEHVPTATDSLMTWRHHERCVLPQKVPGGWREFERRSWGDMAITFYEQAEAGAE